MEVLHQEHINNSLDILFGKNSIGNSRRFLAGLENQILKKAFREKIKKAHPDKAQILGRSPEELNEEACRITEAYQYLLKHLDKKDRVKEPYFYHLPIPPRKLRFAEFLFYSGLIDWDTLISSIVWQFGKRPKTGEIAQELNFLKKEDLFYILRERKVHEKFGEAAIRTRKLKRFQLNVILGRQRQYGIPIGKFFIESGIISNEQLDNLLLENMKHNLINA